MLEKQLEAVLEGLNQGDGGIFAQHRLIVFKILIFTIFIFVVVQHVDLFELEYWRENQLNCDYVSFHHHKEKIFVTLPQMFYLLRNLFWA